MNYVTLPQPYHELWLSTPALATLSKCGSMIVFSLTTTIYLTPSGTQIRPSRRVSDINNVCCYRYRYPYPIYNYNVSQQHHHPKLTVAATVTLLRPSTLAATVTLLPRLTLAAIATPTPPQPYQSPIEL